MVVICARGLDSNALASYAARRGWDDVHAIQDFEAVMRAARAGKVEMLLASGLKGLGKSLQGLAATVRELADRGVGLVIPSLGIVDGASRQVLLNTIACVLESRAAIASERTTHGLARAKRRGVKLGRPRILDAHREDVKHIDQEVRSALSDIVSWPEKLGRPGWDEGIDADLRPAPETAGNGNGEVESAAKKERVNSKRRAAYAAKVKDQ